jgi:phenylacetate-CoA ligase
MRLRDLFFLVELQQNQWKDPRALQEHQNRRLRRLVQHAFDCVPYYRRLFDSVGLQPHEIISAADLAKLPVTSKKDLAGLPPWEVRAQGLEVTHCRKTMTSGSTGVPSTILHRRQDLTRMNLGWLRTYLAHGVRPWHRMAGFSGQRDVPEQRPLYERLGILQRRVLSTWDDPSQWISELRAWQPQALTGYVMTLKLLASAIRAGRVTDIRPDVVFQSSGLLDESSRHFLHSSLRARIVDIYGSAEAGCIAWECPTCSGYHVNSDLVIVELLDDGNPVPAGREGEVVITNLNAYAMPFIRYRQGDVGLWSEEGSQCGRGFPLMRVVEGRLGDFITLPSGKKLSPHHFFVALDTAVGVARWQLVQENEHRLKAAVVVNHAHGTGAHACQAARANLKAIVGEEMEVVVAEVPALPYDPARKFRSVVSLLDGSGTA